MQNNGKKISTVTFLFVCTGLYLAKSKVKNAKCGLEYVVHVLVGKKCKISTSAPGFKKKKKYFSS